MTLNLIPGKSLTFPRFTNTTECWNRFVDPSPGINAVIALPLLSLTLITFLLAELGFFGFIFHVFKQIPFKKGLL
jgi:hypothetical protein